MNLLLPCMCYGRESVSRSFLVPARVGPPHQMTPRLGHRIGAHLLHHRLQLHKNEQVGQGEALTDLHVAESTRAVGLPSISATFPKIPFPIHGPQNCDNRVHLRPRYVLSAKYASIVSKMWLTSVCRVRLIHSNKRQLYRERGSRMYFTSV